MNRFKCNQNTKKKNEKWKCKCTCEYSFCCHRMDAEIVVYIGTKAIDHIVKTFTFISLR